MREVGSLASDTLLKVKDIIRPGITTDDINSFVVDDTKKKRCTAAPLNYLTKSNPTPFPKSVCTSVNEVACHGIPGTQTLKDGDIINVDVTHIYNGWHGDTSATFFVGQVSDDVKNFVSVARNSLAIAISMVKPGVRLGTIGSAIENYIQSSGFSVVRDYTGHGIGKKFHTEPSIAHHGVTGRGLRLKPGMVFTIEPMINMGSDEVTQLDDGWTVVTSDGKPSAQFEHTILVTDAGYEILTLS